MLLLVLLLQSLLCVAAGIADDPSARPIAPQPTRDATTRQLLTREWEVEIKNIIDVRGILRFNDKFVPVIGGKFRGSLNGGVASNATFFQKRTELFDYGCYPGVEYRIKELALLGEDGTRRRLDSLEDISPSQYSSVFIKIRPAYPLIKELERAWPVEVPISRIPGMLSRGSYNIVTVLVSAGSSLSLLAAAFALSSMVTLSVINSRSMEPSILPKDIIVVEKVSPYFKAGISTGDIVFFTPPRAMSDYISANGLPAVGDNTLIVKRVGAAAGVSCAANTASVLGDNEQYSLDSRFWGCVPLDNMVGRPLFRLLPFSRFGALK